MSFAAHPAPRLREARPARALRLGGVAWLVAAEGAAGLVGFGATVRIARILGPSGFGVLEYATATASWLLIAVRGGIELVVYREAARRPRLAGPLTDLLLGLKCAGAAAGYLGILALASLAGPPARAPLAIAGLILIPSALVADVLPRAEGRFHTLALAQLARTLGYVLSAWLLVRESADINLAAACLTVGEVVGCLILGINHATCLKPPRPRLRWRAWVVLSRRGTLASAIRFLRVGLYGADVLVLGLIGATQLGPYAAGRRVVLALVALGLAVPTFVSTTLARAWAVSTEDARTLLWEWTWRLFAASLPASVGLAATSHRWAPLLFGPSYATAGPWLALAAARLSVLLLASLSQAALIACRREPEALRQAALMAVVALSVLPALAWAQGPWGVGLGILIVESLGIASGWRGLARIGLPPLGFRKAALTLLGSAVLFVVCRVGESGPLVVVVLSAILAYAATWWVGLVVAPLRRGGLAPA